GIPWTIPSGGIGAQVIYGGWRQPWHRRLGHLGAVLVDQALPHPPGRREHPAVDRPVARDPRTFLATPRPVPRAESRRRGAPRGGGTRGEPSAVMMLRCRAGSEQRPRRTCHRDLLFGEGREVVRDVLIRRSVER